MTRVLALLALLGCLTGCTTESSRHVVVDPAAAGTLNSPDWTVKGEPSPTPPTP